VDLDGFYEGESLFLLGGSPTLKDLPLELLRQNGIVTLGMNNVPCTFKPTLWVCADKPQCFSPHIYASPEITKFTMISRRGIEVPGTGRRIMEYPSMLFYGATDKYNFRNFLDPGRDLAWWRSVFPIALQLAWRLGFRTVYLTGCGFSMPKQKGKQYAWDTALTPDQANYSQNTYIRDVDRLRSLKPTFDRHGFNVFSSTPGSRANGILRYVPFEEAVEFAVEGKPAMADTSKLIHSSALSAPAAPAKKPEPVAV
jgi:hypothetical protein